MKNIPGVYDTPIILNLHFYYGIPNIAQRMSGLRLQWKTKVVAADSHLALLGLKIWGTALWEFLFLIIFYIIFLRYIKCSAAGSRTDI